MIDVPVEVKDALREGRLKKNYRIVVLDNEGTEDFTIDNNNLVSESVSIDERMCSGDKIKFGLCEGSSMEFQYFGLPSIQGKRLQVFCDVDYGAEDLYTIPVGYFDVKKCSRQASTGIIKVTAYNKLQSEYLDAEANSIITSLFDNPNMPVTFYDIYNVLLDNFEIERTDLEKVRMHYEGGIGYVRKLSGNPVTFKSKYGIDTPLSYYQLYPWVEGASPTAYLYTVASETACTLESDKTYTFRSNYDLNELEQHYYDFTLDMLTKSFTGDSAARLLNPQNSSGSEYESYLGWHQFFGICIEKVGGIKEWYSKIGYENNLTNVVGSINDLLKTTIKNAIKITAYIPASIFMSSSSSSPTGNYWNQFYYYKPSQSWQGRYTYYTNSELTLVEHGYCLFRDTNGDVIENLTWTEYGWKELYRYSDISPQDTISVIPSQLPQVTMREAVSASYELNCQFGQLDRVTDLFSGVELNRSRLLPAETLYPDNALYPDGAQASATKSMYSQLWADEGNVHKWRNLIITYKGLDDQQQEQDFVYTAEINSDGTDDYVCSDNWLFRNLVWTQAQIEEYADTMVSKMQDMTWFPFEMWCAGLPYLETGDEIEIPMGQNSYTSYVLQRQLKGIQNLQDTYINGTLDIF